MKTATKPPPKPVRPRSQPMRLWCVEYMPNVNPNVKPKYASHRDVEEAERVYVTTIEALTAALALERFDLDYPNVKVVRVY